MPDTTGYGHTAGSVPMNLFKRLNEVGMVLFTLCKHLVKGVGSLKYLFLKGFK